MITVNINKAKLVAHKIRRYQRELEFVPFDSIISKQIPGDDYQNAEISRQEIRNKYIKIQNDIDNASDIDTLSEIVESLR